MLCFPAWAGRRSRVRAACAFEPSCPASDKRSRENPSCRSRQELRSKNGQELQSDSTRRMNAAVVLRNLSAARAHTPPNVFQFPHAWPWPFPLRKLSSCGWLAIEFLELELQAGKERCFKAGVICLRMRSDHEQRKQVKEARGTREGAKANGLTRMHDAHSMRAKENARIASDCCKGRRRGMLGCACLVHVIGDGSSDFASPSGRSLESVAAGLIVLNRLDDLLPCVHHEWAMLHDGLVQRLTGDQNKISGLSKEKTEARERERRSDQLLDLPQESPFALVASPAALLICCCDFDAPDRMW